MDFSQALLALKAGSMVTRSGWNGKGMYLKAQFPDEGSKMGKPYVYIKIVTWEFVPWIASHWDLFGEDWEVLPDPA